MFAAAHRHRPGIEHKSHSRSEFTLFVICFNFGNVPSRIVPQRLSQFFALSNRFLFGPNGQSSADNHSPDMRIAFGQQ
jgi:hypothetical protein